MKEEEHQEKDDGVGGDLTKALGHEEEKRVGGLGAKFYPYSSKIEPRMNERLYEKDGRNRYDDDDEQTNFTLKVENDGFTSNSRPVTTTSAEFVKSSFSSSCTTLD
ncbi:hypothetical protein M0802_004383 [Mischocyttarus mexicanus]|nr:hypothetical protein M0802_004383 [Mischocyttarus mexicanus]